MNKLPLRKPLLLLLTVLLVSCNLPAATNPGPVADPATQTPTTYVSNEPCAYQWASRGLPDLSSQVQSAMEAAGLKDLSARAEAYGEDCISSDPKQTPSFGAMETDYHISVKVASLDDRDDLGARLEKILTVLDQFPVGTTPGPQPGYVGVSFQTESNQLNLWFHIADGKSAREQGLHGAALLDQFLNK
jgi:hypothetical protein